MGTRWAHNWVARFGIFGMRLQPEQLSQGRERERVRSRPAVRGVGS